MKGKKSLSAAVALAALWSGTAAAQVSCANPNNLCVGDPCVMGEVEVLSPCVVNFGARDLVLTRTVMVPNGGVLSFTADNIEVDGKILARHIAPGSGDGGDVTLIANNSITVLKRIDTSGRTSAGNIVLDAGSSITLRAPISSAAKGSSPSGPGGDVTMSAQTSLSSTHRGRIKAKGKGTPGGNVTMSGATVVLDGGIDARGSTGGSVSITSSAGSLLIGDRIEVDGTDFAGGDITIDGPTQVSTARKLDADGETTGGTIDVSGATVSISGNLQARGSGSNGNGGTISLDAQTLSLRNVRLRGRTNAGTLTATAGAGGLTITGQIDSRAVNGVGGATNLSATGSVLVMRRVRSDGHTQGGAIDIESTGSFVSVDDRLNVDSSSGGGGSVSIAAATDILLDGGADAGGTPGGTVVASAGDDLEAHGFFGAQSGGCISMTAVGTLDIGGAILDPANSGSCP